METYSFLPANTIPTIFWDGFSGLSKSRLDGRDPCFDVEFTSGAGIWTGGPAMTGSSYLNCSDKSMLDLSDHRESLKRLADDENKRNNVHNVNALNTEYLHLNRLPLMVIRNTQDSRIKTNDSKGKRSKPHGTRRVMLFLYSAKVNSMNTGR
jgi:hypothetical protein